MKIFLCHQRERGLTLVELLVVIAILVFLYLMLIPAHTGTRARAMSIYCLNNLKQIGLATRTWEGDHGEKYPWSIPGTNGGTMEFVTGPNEWRHFQIMSNELSTPKVLLCPGDDDSHSVPATNFNYLSNSNLSYFIGLEASESNPQSLLSSDRLTNGTPIRNGILELTTNNPAGWTAEIHKKVGSILLSDGSVQQVSRNGLRQAFLNTNSPTNHLQMPVLTP